MFTPIRSVVKFSGEALGRQGHGNWEREYLAHTCTEIAGAAKHKAYQLAVLFGAGNLLRGATLKERLGLSDGVVADECGMRATVINCMILQHVLESEYGVETRLMTAWTDKGAGERYVRRRALRHMEKGRLVILAGGTGKPDCSTDRALTQYGRELGASLLLKASKVDGIFTGDPLGRHSEPPEHIPYLTYQQFLAQPRKFKQILDRGAVTQAEAHDMIIRVFNIQRADALLNALVGGDREKFTDVGPLSA